jgi:hypothetical protein
MSQSHIQGKCDLFSSYIFFDLLRQRIKSTFKDGDIVNIELKNRGEKQTEEQKDWYAKAFGPK